ncbi:ABC transporter permease [Desulfuribacillus alkaliarsenatis]|uniref:ABC transmembrane type-2 domain-containing protein n=1 Tax=Desulfuribacillus alkaliarsenatis TaxID=766136 RepID=A0A1E5G392_9FIRM|nr:ABC transporter permease [Desulfuribacillus alkaliarsenatis]OEF97528.1 hypothetical protein BHF68_04800 [Desulfuribacillus alkaliarsenatis]
MTQILAITILRIRSLFRDKKSYVFFIGLPILFTVIFGSVHGGTDGNRNLPAVGLLQSEVADSLYYNQLETAKDFVWIKGNYAELMDSLQQGQLIAVVEADTNNITVYKRYNYPEQMQLEALLKMRAQELAMLNQLVPDLDMRDRIEQSWSTLTVGFTWQPRYAVENADEAIGDKTVSFSQASMAIGFALMFMMMNVVIGAGTVIEEKRQGTWKRMLMAPLSSSQIFFGYGIGYFVIGWLQFIILMVVASVLFGVSWGNIISVITVVSLFLASIIALGLLLSQLVKNYLQQQTIGSLVIIASSMLSGIFWPLEIVPEFMVSFAKLMPQYWALNGLVDAMLLNKDPLQLLPPIMSLTILTIVFFGGWQLLNKISRFGY